ncbi:GatB/YqeY domain-containing protein [soil metagenome]
MSESILEQVQADTRTAMKAGEKQRVGALRMVVSALQSEAKEGKDDEVAVLRRERKRRLDAAEAYRDGGSPERAEVEESEAEMISAYLPAELSDEELGSIVDAAIAETGAAGPQDMGKVMGPAMAKVAGKADGKRVSAAVKERLVG